MKKPNFSTDRIINSPAVAVFVAGLIPLISQINSGLFSYTPAQVIVSLVTQLIISLLAASVMVLAGMVLHRIISWLQKHFSLNLSTPPPMRLAHRLMLRLTQFHWVDTLALAGVIAWMQPASQIYQLQILVLHNCPILLFAVRIKTLLTIAVCLVLWHGIRPFNLILLPLLLITLATFPVVLARQVMEPEPPAERSIGKLTFKTRPNVYLFYLESHNSRENMGRVFDIDADPFYQALARLGYVVNDTYSSRTYTMGSAATLMLMRHFSAKEWSTATLDLKRNIHKMVSGLIYNPVLEQFKHNGYRIAYLHRQGYLYRFKSPAIDVTNLESLFTGPQYYLSPIVWTYLYNVKAFQEKEQPLLETIRPIIRKQLDDGHPTFFFIYSGLYHGGANDETEQEFLSQYRQVYHDFIPKFTDLLAFLQREDPGAIVVLIGDHARVRLRDRELDASKLSPEMMAKDKASVFFAIKNPVDNNVWREVLKRPITHVNLFRYLFAILADARSLLDKAEPDITHYVDDSIIARDNQPLKQWERPKSLAQ